MFATLCSIPGTYLAAGKLIKKAGFVYSWHILQKCIFSSTVSLFLSPNFLPANNPQHTPLDAHFPQVYLNTNTWVCSMFFPTPQISPSASPLDTYPSFSLISTCLATHWRNRPDKSRWRFVLLTKTCEDLCYPEW